jgi:ectoine hydroxylase-related dioxygenase (phytanoyl-CoA dioxygenase family)
MDSVDKSGFRIIPRLFSPDALSPVTKALENSSLRRSRAGIRNALQIPTVKAIARSEELFTLAQESLGKSVFPFRATLFDKSPSSNWLVVWHQDTALPVRERVDAPGWGPWSVKDGVVCAHAPASVLEQILAIRVHLDDSNQENGPLRVLPQTHTLGVLSDDAIQNLVKQNSWFECHVPRGGALIMKPLIIHSSSKIKSESARRVLHIEYASGNSLPGGLALAIC